MKIFKIAILIIVLLLPSIANTQQLCGPREQVIKQLSNAKISESRLFLGVSSPTLAIELFVNTETKTWTVFTTNTNGESCLIDYGVGIIIEELKSE